MVVSNTSNALVCESCYSDC